MCVICLLLPPVFNHYSPRKQPGRPSNYSLSIGKYYPPLIPGSSAREGSYGNSVTISVIVGSSPALHSYPRNCSDADGQVIMRTPLTASKVCFPPANVHALATPRAVHNK